MDKELYKIWKELKPLEIEHQDIIQQEGYLTGSSAFRCTTNGSDLDYLLLVENTPDHSFFRDILENKIDFKYVCYSSDYRGEGYVSAYVKFMYSDKPINLLLFENIIDYRRWVWATRIMKILLKSDTDFINKIKDKKNRINLFGVLKEIY